MRVNPLLSLTRSTSVRFLKIRRAAPALCGLLGLSIAAAGLIPLTPAEALAKKAHTEKHKAAQKHATGSTAGPSEGVKTPGVLIPLQDLKFEAQIPIQDPGWITLGKSVVVPSRPKNELVRVDPQTNQSGTPITGLNQPCSAVVMAFGALWAPNCGSQSVSRIDPKTGEIAKILAIGADDTVAGVAATGDSVWVMTDDKTTLSRVDPGNNSVVAEVRLPAGCNSLVQGVGALWVTCPMDDKVLRVNPNSNLVDEYISVAGQPRAAAVGAGSVWVLCDQDGKVERIDPKTNKVIKTIELGVPHGGGNLAFGDGSLWVTQAGFPLTRIDPDSDSVKQQFWGAGGGSIAAGPGAIWLANVKQGTLWRLDPKRIMATIAE
jgi:virginiamycin B lyase